jgi:hypothetical protein
MGLTILIGIIISVAAIFVDVLSSIYDELDSVPGVITFFGALVALLVFIILFAFCRDDITKQDWKITEQYEITYKANFDKSPVFIEFLGNDLTVFIKDNQDNISPIKDFKIVSKGEIAEYIRKERKTEETFFKWADEQRVTEITIPIKLIEKWMEKK